MTALFRGRKENSESRPVRPGYWAMLVLGILLTFSPLFQAGYLLNFDDNTHLYQNELVRRGHLAAAGKIFTSPDTANNTYIPLTALTFLYEQVLWGLNPAVSHTINIVLHLVVCLLAYRLARLLGLSGRAAFWGVVLFAVHPLHVEPVAWVTARKDMLYSVFYLLSLIFYIQHLDSRSGRAYCFALAAAGLSVLAKPMALSLPLVLFLLDMMKGRAWSWSRVLDKVPFFLAVEPVAFITYSMNARPLPVVWPDAVLLWVWSASFYIKKFFWPMPLSLIYLPPRPVVWTNPAVWSGILVLAGTWGVLWSGRRFRWLLFAAGWYAASAFFLWRFDVYDLTIVGDRFMYLPSLGICLLLGAGLALWRSRGGRYARLMSVGLVAALALMSFRRAADWKDPFTLWHAVMRAQPSAYVLDARGESLFLEEYYQASRDSFEKYVARRSGTTVAKMRAVFGPAYHARMEGARRAAALWSYFRAVRMRPDKEELWTNLAMAQVSFHQYERARDLFDMIIARVPAPSAGHYFNRGVTWQHLGEGDKAMADYDQAIRLDSGYAYAYINRAQLWLDRREPLRALADALLAVELAPTYMPAYEMALQIARGFGDAALETRLLRARDYYALRPLERR